MRAAGGNVDEPRTVLDRDATPRETSEFLCLTDSQSGHLRPPDSKKPSAQSPARANAATPRTCAVTRVLRKAILSDPDPNSQTIAAYEDPR